jgi:DNA-3-methyladenine glycosylase II
MLKIERSAGVGRGFTLEPLGLFSLKASAEFIGGFTPASHPGVGEDGHLHLGFCVEGGWEPVGVCLRQVDGIVVGEVHGPADVDAVAPQVARILSLDVDGRRFAEVAGRDKVVGRLAERFDWLRPVTFWSPYEAAVWAVVSQRINMRQAARIKSGMAQKLGERIDVHGDMLEVFPAPSVLAVLEGFASLPERKVPYLRAIGEAALSGRLDAVRLRSGDNEARLAELREMPGIGPMSAEHILIRGAGEPDRVTPMEPRLPRAIALAYDLDHVPSDAEVYELAEAWKPYRTWVMVLLRVAFARDDPAGNARRR